MPVTLHTGGAFSMAGSILGEERMMNWLIKKPDLVHEVLGKVCDFLDQGGRALRRRSSEPRT